MSVSSRFSPTSQPHSSDYENMFLCLPCEGNSNFISPAGSLLSLNGPDLPTRPTSPWISDFYDSEVEVDREPPKSTASANSFVRRPRDESSRPGSAPRTEPPRNGRSATLAHSPYRSQSTLGYGPTTGLQSPQASTPNRNNNAVPYNKLPEASTRDLFDLARQRWQGAAADPYGLDLTADRRRRDNDWRARSQSLPRFKLPSGFDDVIGNTNAAPTNKTYDVKSLRASSSSPLTVTSFLQPKPQQMQNRRTESPAPQFQRYLLCRIVVVIVSKR